MSACENCGKPIVTTDGKRALCKPCKKLAERTNPIQITPMELDDLELVLAWRSNPKIYSYFRKQDSPLDWDTHLSWYESRNQDRHDFIVHYEARRVGVVSITVNEEVSIYLGDFSAHGNGVATAALRWLCERFKQRTPLIAEIHQDNLASKHLFEGCDFQQRGRDGEWKEYSYDP